MTEVFEELLLSKLKTTNKIGRYNPEYAVAKYLDKEGNYVNPETQASWEWFLVGREYSNVN